MNEQKPSIGRIVLFTLNADDAAQINRRRTNSTSIAARLKQEATNNVMAWPAGAQAHIGNEVAEGSVYPMLIVRVWSDTCVNGQVFLDGNDIFWALSVAPGDDLHQWNWPPVSQEDDDV